MGSMTVAIFSVVIVLGLWLTPTRAANNGAGNLSPNFDVVLKQEYYPHQNLPNVVPVTCRPKLTGDLIKGQTITRIVIVINLVAFFLYSNHSGPDDVIHSCIGNCTAKGQITDLDNSYLTVYYFDLKHHTHALCNVVVKHGYNDSTIGKSITLYTHAGTPRDDEFKKSLEMMQRKLYLMRQESSGITMRDPTDDLKSYMNGKPFDTLETRLKNATEGIPDRLKEDRRHLQWLLENSVKNIQFEAKSTGGFHEGMTVLFTNVSGEGYDKTSGKFVAPFKGYYLFQLSLFTSDNQLQVHLVYSDAKKALEKPVMNMTTRGDDRCERYDQERTVLQMDAGDAVHVTIAGTDRKNASVYPITFSGFLLHALPTRSILDYSI